MEIDTNFYGDVMSVNHLRKMKYWFYHGSAKKSMYVRKIKIVGQKVPLDREQKMVYSRARAAARKMAPKRPDGKTLVVGVRYEYYVNTEDVPVWYEYFGNYSWDGKIVGVVT